MQLNTSLCTDTDQEYSFESVTLKIGSKLTDELCSQKLPYGILEVDLEVAL